MGEFFVLIFMGWFAYMSTILVNEKKQRKRGRKSAPSDTP
tara:strand:+ start:690 stop:809 length:120 start_codon:yes stop_codon:yes gene_type:complete